MGACRSITSISIVSSAVLYDLGLREYLFSSAASAVEWFKRLREAPELEF